MGTNFFWHHDAVSSAVLPTGETVEFEIDSDDPRWHIGKRSAAGPYCWDCDLTLCKGGNAAIHHSGNEWFDQCPNCGKTQTDKPGLSGPAGVELGFAEPAVTRPRGVRGTSSFSWAQEPEMVGAICERNSDAKIVQDEYGDLLTGREFLNMLLTNCAVQFTDSIGQRFS